MKVGVSPLQLNLDPISKQNPILETSEVNLKPSKQTSDQYFVPTINNNPVRQIDDREKTHCDSGAEATLAHEQSRGI